MPKIQRNKCPYINIKGKTCGNSCFMEFCWRHQDGQKFRPCLECGKNTRNKHQYCICTNKSKYIEYHEGNKYTPVEYLMGMKMMNILAR